MRPVKTLPLLVWACLLVLSMAATANAKCTVVNFGTYLSLVCTADDTTGTMGGIANSAGVANAHAISDQLSLFNLPTGQQSQNGRASGNGPSGIGVWASGGITQLDNTASQARFHGPLSNFLLGVDEQIDRLTMGLAIGAEHLDLKTVYNSGSLVYDGYSLTPYLSYAITNDLVADASVGYTWLDYYIRDTPTGGANSDRMGGARLVTALNLTKYFMLDKLLLGAKIGTLYLNEHQDSYRVNGINYSTSTTYAWQGSLGLRALYDMGAWRPYAGATYSQDFVKSGGRHNDMWGADFDLGVMYSFSPSLSLSLSGIYGIREYLTKAGANLTLRYDF